MRCIDCPAFYYKGGEYGYCREHGKTIEYDNEEECENVEYFIEA